MLGGGDVQAGVEVKWEHPFQKELWTDLKPFPRALWSFHKAVSENPGRAKRQAKMENDPDMLLFRAKYVLWIVGRTDDDTRRNAWDVFGFIVPRLRPDDLRQLLQLAVCQYLWPVTSLILSSNNLRDRVKRTITHRATTRVIQAAWCCGDALTLEQLLEVLDPVVGVVTGIIRSDACKTMYRNPNRGARGDEGIYIKPERRVYMWTTLTTWLFEKKTGETALDLAGVMGKRCNMTEEKARALLLDHLEGLEMDEEKDQLGVRKKRRKT